MLYRTNLSPTLYDSPHFDCSTTFTISRTNADDPMNLLTDQYYEQAIIENTHGNIDYLEQAMEEFNPRKDPNYVLGPLEWRMVHAQELEKAYTESRSLRHVRVLDWLPILQASTVPGYDVGGYASTHRPTADV